MLFCHLAIGALGNFGRMDLVFSFSMLWFFRNDSLKTIAFSNPKTLIHFYKKKKKKYVEISILLNNPANHKTNAQLYKKRNIHTYVYLKTQHQYHTQSRKLKIFHVPVVDICLIMLSHTNMCAKNHHKHFYISYQSAGVFICIKKNKVQMIQINDDVQYRVHSHTHSSIPQCVCVCV